MTWLAPFGSPIRRIFSIFFAACGLTNIKAAAGQPA
jgi:hypothetical protein